MSRRKAQSKHQRQQRVRAERSEEARRAAASRRLDDMGVQFREELRKAYDAAPTADRKATDALSGELLEALALHPEGLDVAAQMLERVPEETGRIGEGHEGVGPLINAAFTAVLRDPPPVCPHIEQGPRPGALCYQHMAAGVLCAECWPAHVAGHTREQEFTCDLCGVLCGELQGTRSLPQIGLPIRVGGTTRLNPYPITVGGVGACARCL